MLISKSPFFLNLMDFLVPLRQHQWWKGGSRFALYLKVSLWAPHWVPHLIVSWVMSNDRNKAGHKHLNKEIGVSSWSF